MQTRDRIRRMIAERSDTALGLLEELVNIDSGTHTPEGVNAVADVFHTSFAAAGFHVRRHSQDRYGDHLVASVRGRDDKGVRLLLMGHMDTVFDRGTTAARPYTVHGDVAKGPGVHDMKSGLVSCLEATRALLDSGFSDFRQITVLFNSDEEAGSPSSRALIEEAARGSDAAFVLECAYPDATVVTARKGVGRYLLKVNGRAAHAGADPELGISAVEEISRKILEIHALTDHASGRTLNVGVLSGGTRRNVVAAEATAEVDLRVVSRDQAEWVESELRRIVGTPALKGASVTLEGGLNRPPMERTLAIGRLFEIVRSEGRRLGMEVGERATGGGSDGNFIAAVGTPVVDGMGPQGGFAHSLEEYLQLDTFANWVTLLAFSLIGACGK